MIEGTTLYAKEAEYSMRYMDRGYQVVYANASDESGQYVLAGPITFGVFDRIAITGITADRTSLPVGGKVIWTVQTTGGAPGILTYDYTIVRDGVVVASKLDSTSSSISYTPSKVGVVRLNVTVSDARGETASATSDPVTVS